MIPHIPQSHRAISLIMLIFGAVALIPCAVMLFFGFHLYNKTETQKSTWIPAEGTVVRVLEEEDSHEHPLYRCVYSFTPTSGEETELTSNTASRPAAHAVGDKVRILYPEGAPAEGKEDCFSEFHLWPTVVLSAGGLDGLFAICMLLGGYFLRRKARGSAV